MRNYCLLVGVLNTDSDTNIALGLVTLDHTPTLDQMPLWFTLASTFVSM